MYNHIPGSSQPQNEVFVDPLEILSKKGKMPEKKTRF